MTSGNHDILDAMRREGAAEAGDSAASALVAEDRLRVAGFATQAPAWPTTMLGRPAVGPLADPQRAGAFRSWGAAQAQDLIQAARDQARFSAAEAGRKRAWAAPVLGALALSICAFMRKGAEEDRLFLAGGLGAAGGFALDRAGLLDWAPEPEQMPVWPPTAVLLDAARRYPDFDAYRLDFVEGWRAAVTEARRASFGGPAATSSTAGLIASVLR